MLPRSRHALTILVVILGIVPVGAPAAQAHEGPPPFEFVFPQEVSVTLPHDDWRARRSGGRRHEGNDLMAPKMTEVYAAGDGVVAKIAESRRAGRYLIIEHVEGWETYYIHLNDDNLGTDDGDAPWSLTIASGLVEGSKVVAGQLIGFVGDSGNAEGAHPHTHFELLHGGTPQDPHELLMLARERAMAAAAARRSLPPMAYRVYIV
jgi:murein DD-endopeptidase MepM/ murein hydrolase activator NlpD